MGKNQVLDWLGQWSGRKSDAVTMEVCALYAELESLRVEAPAVDLEQFREAVEAYKDQADMLLMPEERVAKADRLIALIDTYKDKSNG